MTEFQYQSSPPPTSQSYSLAKLVGVSIADQGLAMVRAAGGWIVMIQLTKQVQWDKFYLTGLLLKFFADLDSTYAKIVSWARTCSPPPTHLTILYAGT
jgi:hypothetical protein